MNISCSLMKRVLPESFSGWICTFPSDLPFFVPTSSLRNAPKAKNLSNILKPYYTTKKKGTGLGLSIVNKILNDHNSSINFIKQNIGAKIVINFSKNGNWNTYNWW